MSWCSFFSSYAVLGLSSVMVVRMQNLEYPHHASLKGCTKEILKNDIRRFRLLYLGLAPQVISMGIIMATSFFAVFAKKLFVTEVNKKEKRDFFAKIDWTQPENIKDEDIQANSPQNQLRFYARKAIAPAIWLLGSAFSQPFYVISMHVINSRYNDVGNVMTHKESACRNSYRAFYYIRRKYGMRGFMRGFMPTTLFTTIVLWDLIASTVLLDED